MDLNAIKTSIRSRHNLAEDTDVRIITSALVIKDAGEQADPYKFTARITTDSVDRQDEVVIPQGGDVTEFLRCGIVAWNHDYNIPVGFPNKSGKFLRGDNFIECPAKFMKRPDDYQGEFFPDFARAFVTQAMEAQITPGVSIGFIPVESRNANKADIETYGPQVRMVHSKWKLLEFSIAPVQANQDAVITAIGKGLIAKNIARKVGIELPDPPPGVIELPDPKTPPECHPPVSVEEEAIVVVLRRKAYPDLSKMVATEARKMILKSFGKIYG